MTSSPTNTSRAGTEITLPSRMIQAVFDSNSSRSPIARLDPAAVRSLIQSPSFISHVISAPAT